MGFISDTVTPKIREIVTGDRPPVVPVVPLRGVIGQMGPMRKGLTLESLAEILDSAFKVKKASAVALVVNSPGGSPVQSALIARRIRQLADENDVKVIAFCEDVAASGGYWLACAADEIIVDDNSIVGSIGVISSSLGFSEAIKKIGVTRRLHTAGDKKSFMDPFQPEKKADVARLKEIQGDMHESFQDYVRSRRGAALKDDPDLFSGAFWTGRRAVELGLADATGDLREELRQRFGERVRMPVFKKRKGWLSRRFGANAGADVSIWADGLIAAVEERMIWDRYRL
ncbi:MAG: S49 family peptidase [Rhodospirillales bacterium]|nr:S49 family peptidase [Rhodospirillales bacterium]MBO6787264.1 S49 family peptidase [Rhodospirillales bacterium]